MVAAQQNWSKSDSMFAATIIRTALLLFLKLFHLFWTEFFQYPDAFKNWGEGVYLKRIHNNNKITGQAYVLSLLFLRYRQAA